MFECATAWAMAMAKATVMGPGSWLWAEAMAKAVVMGRSHGPRPWPRPWPMAVAMSHCRGPWARRPAEGRELEIGFLGEEPVTPKCTSLESAKDFAQLKQFQLILLIT